MMLVLAAAHELGYRCCYHIHPLGISLVVPLFVVAFGELVAFGLWNTVQRGVVVLDCVVRASSVTWPHRVSAILLYIDAGVHNPGLYTRHHGTHGVDC